MEARSLNGILVTSNDNVFYTTGLPVTRGQQNPILFGLSNKFPPYAVIHPDGIPSSIVWTGAIGNHELWTKDVRTSFFPGGTTEELLSCVEESFSKRSKIGVESTFPFPLAEKVKGKLEDVELEIVDDIFEELRIKKSAEEIAKLKKSLDIAEQVEKRVFEEMRPDWTVFKLVSRSKQLIFELGGTGVDHTTIAIGKSNPEILEDFKSNIGDIVVLDIGAILDGYVSDTRRLGHIGEAPEPLKNLNGVMANIVTETGANLIPGKTFAQICEEVEARFKKQGRDPLFLSAGHSIGIQTEEVWITRDSNRMIEENMIFNIELYSSLETGRWVGTEDTFLVTASGGQQLSNLPHDIIEIK